MAVAAVVRDEKKSKSLITAEDIAVENLSSNIRCEGGKENDAKTQQYVIRKLDNCKALTDAKEQTGHLQITAKYRLIKKMEVNGTGFL